MYYKCATLYNCECDHHLVVMDPVACDVYAYVCSSSSVVECASVYTALVTLVGERHKSHIKHRNKLA